MLTPELHEEHPFRVYSERQVDASRFVWSPYMDLLAFFPTDASNPSVTIWRLINDKQNNSPLLFTEKIPFQGTALVWVPDRRSLCVGDVAGNVFVYDAERQRTVELQKVHESEIAHIDWLDLGVMGSKFAIQAMSRESLLPPIYPTISSIQTWAEEYEFLQSQQALVCDQMAYSDKLMLMTVLGRSGGVSVYAGGSIPVCEFSLAPGNYSMCKLSPEGSKLALLSEDNAAIHIMDLGLFPLRKVELFTLSRIEARIHWLLKQLGIAVDVVSRAVSRPMEEYAGLLEPMDRVDARSFLAKSFSLAKMSALQKSTVNCLDYLVVVLVSHVGVIADHLLAASCELADNVHSRRFRVFGIEPVQVENSLINSVVELRKCLDSQVTEIQGKVRLIKDLFETHLIPWVNGENVATTPSSSIDTTGLSCSINFSSILELGKKIESGYTSILSTQRRSMGSRISPFQPPLAIPSRSPVSLKWQTDDLLAACYIDVDGYLVVANFTFSGGAPKLIQFTPPIDSEWTSSPKLYSDHKVFALLQHLATNSVSICSIDCTQFQQPYSITVSPDEYGYSEILATQQLPNWYFNNISEFELCPERALCSVVSRDNQRVLTLDLEYAEEDIEEDDGGRFSSSDDNDQVHAVKNQPNKIIGKKNAQNEDIVFTRPDDRESPEIGNYFA